MNIEYWIYEYKAVLKLNIYERYKSQKSDI